MIAIDADADTGELAGQGLVGRAGWRCVSKVKTARDEGSASGMRIACHEKGNDNDDNDGPPSIPHSNVQRRDFLKLMGAGGMP